MSDSQSQARLRGRANRSALPKSEREARSAQIATRLAGYLPFRKARRIGVYLSMTEEVDTGPVIELCQALDKQVFAPVISRTNIRQQPMLFMSFEPGKTALRENRFGIVEPVHKPGEPVRGTELDFVCVPVVAFNRRCERIGMGGGYYDRTFATTRRFKSVRLVGLAFDCQEAEFETHTHDVPMDAIITESTVHERKKGQDRE